MCVMLAPLAFWFIRVDNALIIFLAFWEAGRWPVQVYPEWLGRTLTFLVPVAFATTASRSVERTFGPGNTQRGARPGGCAPGGLASVVAARPQPLCPGVSLAPTGPPRHRERA